MNGKEKTAVSATATELSTAAAVVDGSVWNESGAA
jgi:hypothetical protein